MQVLPEGQYIKHELYGFGVVMESDAERTTIDFDQYGRKKFVTSLMAAELVGEAPAKAARPKRRRKTSAAPAKTAAKRSHTLLALTDPTGRIPGRGVFSR